MHAQSKREKKRVLGIFHFIVGVDGAEEKKGYNNSITQRKHKNFLLDLRNNQHLEHYFQLPRLQRAIGVIYRPDTERQSHYFFTRLPYQIDAIIHFDKTSAVQPLDINSEWQKIDHTEKHL